MTADCISVILPVYNEEGNIAACLRGLTKALEGIEHEILVCYDFDEDTTLPAIARMADKPPAVKLVRNALGKGAAAAIRAGFQAARGDVLVTTMADLSDPPEVIRAMARKIREEGADVVSGSRYMKGGSQTGGPRLKTLLSKAAGLSLRWVAGLGTHDATTNFRAYSRRFIEKVEIRSQYGMELALELTVKAHLQGFRVDEVPSSWQDRSAGQSRFQLWKWLPRYLRWYLLALGDPLFVGVVFLAASAAALVFAVRNAPVLPFWDEWAFVPVLTGDQPFGLGWLWEQHYEHRIPLAKLMWYGVTRLSGGDPRWATGLITLLLCSSAWLLLRGLRRFRGHTVWTDAFIPLLLLHWDHWENMTWPFQIPFAVHLLVLSFLLSKLLELRRRPPLTLALPIGLGLLALPLCGASALPYAALLASGWLLVVLREGPRTGRALRLGLPAAALLLTGLCVMAWRRISDVAPSPNLAGTLTATWQFLTGSLGFQGSRTWRASGWLTLGVLALAVALPLRSLRRDNGRRLPAAGVILMLAGTVALGVMVGHARASNPYAGFFDRYVTLSCLFPALAYAAAEFGPWPLLGRIVRTALAVLMAALFVPNAGHAWDLTAARRLANGRLTHDIRSGVPIPMLARLHANQHLGDVDVFEERLRMVARARLYLFRSPDLPASLIDWKSGSAVLADGRIASNLPLSREVQPGSHDIRIDFGRLHGSNDEVRFRARRVGRDGRSETLWTSSLTPPASQRNLLRAQMQEGDRLAIDVEGAPPGARYWAVLEFHRP